MWEWISNLNVNEVIGYGAAIVGGGAIGVKVAAGVGLVKAIFKSTEGKWFFLHKWFHNLGKKVSKKGTAKFGAEWNKSIEAEVLRATDTWYKHFKAGMKSV